jgi:uncharacterized protein (DUF2461 family)
MEFPGFSQETFGFLAELTENNNREWFAENESRYQEFILEPFRKLVRELGPGVEKLSPLMKLHSNIDDHLSTIERGERVPPGTPPFKTSFYCFFWDARYPRLSDGTLYVGLSVEGIAIGFSLYDVPDPQAKLKRVFLPRLRHHVRHLDEYIKGAYLRRGFDFHRYARAAGRLGMREVDAFPDLASGWEDTLGWVVKRHIHTESSRLTPGSFVAEAQESFEKLFPLYVFSCNAEEGWQRQLPLPPGVVVEAPRPVPSPVMIREQREAKKRRAEAARKKEEDARLAAEKKERAVKLAAEKKAKAQAVAAEKARIREEKHAEAARQKAEEKKLAAERRAEAKRIAAERKKIENEKKKALAQKKAEAKRKAAEKKKVAAEKKKVADMKKKAAAKKKAEALKKKKAAAKKKAETLKKKKAAALKKKRSAAKKKAATKKKTAAKKKKSAKKVVTKKKPAKKAAKKKATAKKKSAAKRKAAARKKPVKRNAAPKKRKAAAKKKPVKKAAKKKATAKRKAATKKKAVRRKTATKKKK